MHEQAARYIANIATVVAHADGTTPEAAYARLSEEPTEANPTQEHEDAGNSTVGQGAPGAPTERDTGQNAEPAITTGTGPSLTPIHDSTNQPPTDSTPSATAGAGYNDSEAAGEEKAGAEGGAANRGLPTGIYADSKGVYGYLPSPGSRYASELYDFTDPSFVARQRDIRIGYLNDTANLEKAINTMRAGGVEEEAIARRVVIQRNSQKIEARALMTADEVSVAGAKSMKDFGHPVGPTPDQMFKKYGDWNIVIEKSMQKDPAINMLLGLSPGK
jgi:hypothetical protein